jgi:K+-transporting ATPase ATPase C chain
MLRQLRPALVMIVGFTLLTGVAYPLAVTGVAQATFPRQASGGLVERDGKIVGADLIGQAFTTPRYFASRPSATTATDPNDATKSVPAPYNASNSGGSNAAPTAKTLVDRVKGDADAYRTANGGGPVPADAVTTSASGLDPHISPANAQGQIARVAKARNLPEDRVRALVEQQTEPRTLGLLGEPRVNVLRLNLALDALQAQIAVR